MAKLEAEKQALADLKKDPIALDPDAESLARLKALSGEAQRSAQAHVPVQTAQVPSASLSGCHTDSMCGYMHGTSLPNTSATVSRHCIARHCIAHVAAPTSDVSCVVPVTVCCFLYRTCKK